MSLSILRLLALAAGLGLASGGLGLLWPQRPDLRGPAASRPGDSPAGGLPLPRDTLTVLLIGSDADTVDAASNGAAPSGPANSDSLLLLRFNEDGPVQVLNVPRELAVNVPGEDGIVPLGRLFRLGGPALTASVLAELVGLDRGEPARYAVLPRRTLRQLVENLGGVELRLDRTYRYSDGSQNLSIDLQGGRQRLNGSQAEHLARFQEGPERENERRLRQDRLMRGLLDELRQPAVRSRLPALVSDLYGSVSTNLSERESLSLLTATLANRRPVQFGTLPLKAPREAVRMRELEGDPGPDLWKTP
jgi:LCP family protein required for cell wall assembly